MPINKVNVRSYNGHTILINAVGNNYLNETAATIENISDFMELVLGMKGRMINQTFRRQ